MAHNMYLNYINNFRGIAIVLIVAGHSLQKLRTAFTWDDAPLLYAVLSVTMSNATVLFVFIAGFLFQYLSHKYRFGKYLVNKTTNIILPYVVVSIPIIVLQTSGLVQDAPFPDSSLSIRVVLSYLTGAHFLPFWFIPMMAIMYLVSPLLVRLDRDQRIYFLLPVFVVISSIVPRQDSANIPASFAHFFSVYLFGMFCSRYREAVLHWTKRLVLPLLALMLVLLALDVWMVMDRPRLVGYISYLNLWEKLLWCPLLLLFLYERDQQLGKRFDFLAATSFAVYFLHYYFITFLGRFVPPDPGPPIVKLGIFFAFTGVIMIISILCVLLVKRIVGSRSRLLIGY